MKKTICVLLAILMMATVLIGCGNTVDPKDTTEGTASDDYTPDSTLRILMMGNSFCYYYVEELYELLMENPPAGIDAVEIYNLYYSGSNLTQHFSWWKQDAAKYELFKTSANGREKLADKWTLEQALVQAEWDYISLHGSVDGGSYTNEDKRESTRDSIAELAEPLLDRFHELHPNAQLLWQRTWFTEIGRIFSNGYVYTAEDGPKYDAGMQEISDYMCNEFDKNKPYDLKMVNSGAAWTEARILNETKNLLPNGGLCARLGVSNPKTYQGAQNGESNVGDGYHDGDIGGGQLLNAYMWYMTLTGNTDLTQSEYAPVYKHDGLEYPLSAELIDMLKQAAMTAIKK